MLTSTASETALSLDWLSTITTASNFHGLLALLLSSCQTLALGVMPIPPWANVSLETEHMRVHTLKVQQSLLKKHHKLLSMVGELDSFSLVRLMQFSTVSRMASALGGRPAQCHVHLECGPPSLAQPVLGTACPCDMHICF